MANYPSEKQTRIAEPFHVSDAAQDVIYSAGDAIKRVARDGRLRAQQFERRAQQQIRRYPLSSVLGAAAIGMALGGLVVASLTDFKRESSWRRIWRQFSTSE